MPRRMPSARPPTIQRRKGWLLRTTESWFPEMEDKSRGIGGMIVRSVPAPPPPVDVAASKGLFKIDFGHFENEREIVDAAGNPTGTFPEPLTNWTVIPTWTFTEPNANVVA